MASVAPIPSESPRSDFGPRMVPIPEGNFQIGSEIGQDNERPVHRVWVDAFELAAHQVTNADYALFLEANEQPKPPHWDDPKFNHPNQPVVATSWFDASAYCSWLSRGCTTDQPACDCDECHDGTSHELDPDLCRTAVYDPALHLHRTGSSVAGAAISACCGAAAILWSMNRCLFRRPTFFAASSAPECRAE